MSDPRELQLIAEYVAGSFQTVESLAQSFIREAIVRGAFPPGHRINLDEVATALHISRMPVRAGLRQLEAEGLIKIHPRRGATVSVLEPREIAEIYEMRMVLETYLLELALPKLTSRTLAELRAISKAVEATDDLGQRLNLRGQYYRTLYELADRPRTLAVVENLRSSVGRYLSMQPVDEDPHHEAMLSFLEARDLAGARSWLRSHLMAVSERIQNMVATTVPMPASTVGDTAAERPVPRRRRSTPR